MKWQPFLMSLGAAINRVDGDVALMVIGFVV